MPFTTRLAAIATLILLLAACGGATPQPDAPGQAGDTESQAADPVELCVSSDCGEVFELVSIPDAENIHFSPEGRLFVTGGSNVYEIRALDGELQFEAVPLSEQSCNFTGMAQKQDYLYVVCGDGRLFGTLLTENPAVAPIHQMDGMCIANGTVLGPDGHLYIVDEPLDPSCDTDPKIIRLELDPGDPAQVTGQVTWVQGDAFGTLPFGVGTDSRFPNGLAVRDNRFYSTDGGSVFYVDLLEDGSAGPVTPIFFEPTAHDDLSLAGDTLLVTDFFGGRILQLSLDGQLLQETQPGTFDSPSAVQVGQPPLFRADDILVTEKGLLLEQNLPIDVLSVFRKRD